MIGIKSLPLLLLHVICILCVFQFTMAEEEVCKDGSICYHGSTCIPFEKGFKAANPNSPNGKRSYRCDCSTTSGTYFYAGYGCEYPAYEYCLLGITNKSRKSFCTNGECVEKYMPEDDDNMNPEHLGCECRDGFEGDFCEYKNGDSPVPISRTGMIVSLVLGSTALIAVAGVIMLRKRSNGRSRAKMTEISTAGSPVDSPKGTTEDRDDIIVEDIKVHQNDVEMI
jgi:hypothetical protein